MRVERQQTSASTFVVACASALLMVARLALTVDPVRGLWAEDGAVFLQDATHHPWESLTSQYAGYGLFVARLLGELGRVVPVDDWPLLVLVASALVVGLVSAVVFEAALALDVATPAAVVAALLSVLLPGFGYDILGVWANLQWVLAYALAWVLIAPPDRSNRIVGFTVGLFAVAGGIVCAFICPLVLLHGRRWYRHPAVPGIVAGALYQLLVQITPDVSLGLERHPRLLPSTVKQMAVRTGRALIDSGGGLLNTQRAGYVGIVVVIVMIVIVATSHQRRVGLALIASAALTVATLSIANGNTAPRYATLAAALMGAALVIAVGTRGDFHGWRVGVIVVLCVPWMLSLPVSKSRGSVPGWSHEVARAHVQCAKGAHAVRLSVGPVVDGKPWGSAYLTCDSL